MDDIFFIKGKKYSLAKVLKASNKKALTYIYCDDYAWQIVDEMPSDRLEMYHVRNAQLELPVIVVDGRVVFGMHRLIKGFFSGNTDVKAIIFYEDELEEFEIKEN